MSKEVLKNRYEIMCLVEAKMCNPNGDPDMGNRPRLDFETNIGIITDVALKSRQRAYVNEAYAGKEGFDILMQNGASVNRQIAEAVLTVNETDTADTLPKKDKKPVNPKVGDSAKFMCDKYWDVRTFGAVLSTGLNAGQVRGAVQFGMATSVDPIEIEDITITRKCYADSSKFNTIDEYDAADAKMSDDEKRTMGTKQFTPYGLYVVKATVSANLAEKVGFTEDDLSVLLEAIMQMYNCDASSSKMGMSVLSPVIVFKHVGTQADKTSEQSIREAKLGCTSAYKLFDLLQITRKDGIDYARSYKDYDMVLNKSSCPAGVEIGVKLSPYSDVVWDFDGDDMITVK